MRNAAEELSERGQRGEERRGIANAMRGPIYAGRKQTLKQAGTTVGDDDVHSGLGFWDKLIDFIPIISFEPFTKITTFTMMQ